MKSKFKALFDCVRVTVVFVLGIAFMFIMALLFVQVTVHLEPSRSFSRPTLAALLGFMLMRSSVDG